MTTIPFFGGGSPGASAYEIYAAIETAAGRTPLSLAEWNNSHVPWVFNPAAPNWAPGTNYATKAAVVDDGSLYYAKAPSIGVKPSTNAAFWAMILQGVDLALYNDLLAEGEGKVDAADAFAAAAAEAKAEAEAAAAAAAASVLNAQAASRTVATWSALLAITATAEGTGAEVLDSDAGTHSDATSTGYNGATVNNAGRYSWNNTWGRWVRIGGTGLSSKIGTAELNAKVNPLIGREDLEDAPSANTDLANVVDSDGNMLARFTAAGRVVVPLLGVGSSEIDDAATVRHDVLAAIDATGNTIARLGKDGTLEAVKLAGQSLDLSGETVATVEATATDALLVVRDEAGNSVLRINRTGGVDTVKLLIGGAEAAVNEGTVTGDLFTVADEANNAVLRVDSEGVLHATFAETTAETTALARFGQERMRETRARLQALKLGVNVQYKVALIGDSFTHRPQRYSGKVHTMLSTDYGDAGGGWVGFAQNGSAALANGNVRPSTYTMSNTGTWDASVYATGVGPDIGQMTSTSAGAKFTLGGPATPVLSAAVLFWIGTANGVVRYRWNAGSWTTLNVQGTVGAVQTGAMSTGMPTSGAWTLEIEVVSGTVTLCGVDLQSAAAGIVVHKLGATGSRLVQWAAVDATLWQAGFAALAPDAVVIMHGTNDQGQSRTPTEFANDLGILMDRIRAARPTADILVAMPPENQRTGMAYPMSAYAAAALPVVQARDAAWIDTQLRFGLESADYAFGSARPWFNNDDVHPADDLGGSALCAAVLDGLTLP